VSLVQPPTVETGLAAPGGIVPVLITGATSQTLIGELSLVGAASSGR
jgi:hypothetical protein